MEQDGRVALVTGAGRGLGAAVATSLARMGMIVVAADIDREAASRVADAVRKLEGNALAVGLDVADERQAEGAVGQVMDRYGRLDVLVNNAGTDRTAPVDELSVQDWDRIIGVNLRGPFLLSRLVFPIMRRQGGGHIVNIASTASLRAWPNASAYHASKWGLRGFSHALHVEGRPHGIRVAVIIAGGMRTAFLFDRFPDIDPANLQEPMNVAGAVRFVLTQPEGTVVPELMVYPTRETSWP